ncbi:A-kinase anchor protein 10, mitochondrial-like isoform X2 [Macrosteles quadrilineatus]|uniref:A-kinase anchor protein 10, mitochondrial-like isoform X2 n=1 Tax=Macrosteles quadrilineatus TaxID=74068 RepID=UPI0023E307B8|nr:A-kinase anchor protein 10, mitochondrial-like isoform X2 [Macrosteles quadrilineatus]
MMLQFWKKTINKEKVDRTSNQNVNGVALPVGVFLPSLSDSTAEGPLANFQHDGYTDTPPPQRSRLSPNLLEVLQDRVALSYFAHFADLRGHAPLLSLLLDLQDLRTSDSSGASVSVSGRLRCGSDSDSPITRRKFCQRYLTEELTQRFRIPEDISARVSQDGDDQTLQQLYDFAYHTMKRELWCDFLRSEFFSKYQVEVLTSGTVTLSDIMYHNSAVAAFIEFLEQEGCGSVIEFWQTATTFQRQLRPDSDPTTSVNQAISIYDKYLSLQATCPLGIDHATRCEVESRICVEGAAPLSDCLEPALRKVWAYLRYVCLPLFLSSQSYVQLISELMRATRANSSPASSVTDISVESSRSRFDPDLIWRRRHHDRGLSIGRIDQLGRFETDIEPEPDKKSESRITRVVKKLVNKDEQKAQEEMAWRVAEMIVKDVTNLTMGGHGDDDDL